MPFLVTLFVLFTHGFVDGLGERLHGLAASGTDDQRIGLDSVGDWTPGKSNARSIHCWTVGGRIGAVVRGTARASYDHAPAFVVVSSNVTGRDRSHCARAVHAREQHL